MTKILMEQNKKYKMQKIQEIKSEMENNKYAIKMEKWERVFSVGVLSVAGLYFIGHLVVYIIKSL